MISNARLSAVRVFVSDLAGACAFYRDQVGLTPAETSLDDGYAVFPLANGANLLLEAEPPAEDTDGQESEGLIGRFVGASLGVDDIQAAFAALSDNGVRFVGEPERQPWGGWLAHFHDPDDNILTLVEMPRAD